MKYIMMVILLSLPVSAYADWGNGEMHPVIAPNFSPHQNPVRIEPQHRLEPPRTVVHNSPPVFNHTESVRYDHPVNHYQAVDRHVPGYFRRDANYYGYAQVSLPYSDVDSNFVVPDGFETVMVDGQVYFYNEGVFYQQIGNQLVAVPPVIGAVVGSIPEDYQIVMADGVHYLFTDGVFYQRVDQGFEVVQPPVSDQE